MSTIVALATPPGVGALHVIRMSGTRAFEIINEISVDKVEKTEDRIQITYLRSRNNQLIDQVVISKFFAPNSYTGEDCVEISCHGNGLISKLIIDELIKFGAIYAERGEFTKRAFLNDKIDLNQALNIGNLFKADNEVDIYSSVQEIKGSTSGLIRRFIDELFSIMALCELNIDYPPDIEEDNLEFVVSLKERIFVLWQKIENLLKKSRRQKFSNYRVVFTGKPNAGKSSLVNFLIEEDRIIVSDRAGTTQDSIEVDCCFEGYLLTLVDTAGIEMEKDFENLDCAKKSKKELDTADLIIYLRACNDPCNNDDFFDRYLKSRNHICIFTKYDLIEGPCEDGYISVKKKDIRSFLNLLRKNLEDNYVTTGIKFKEGINFLSVATRELKNIIFSDLSVDLMSEHLNLAYDNLCKIIGKKKSNMDKINELFDSFCVGK